MRLYPAAEPICDRSLRLLGWRQLPNISQVRRDAKKLRKLADDMLAALGENRRLMLGYAASTSVAAKSFPTNSSGSPASRLTA